MDMLNFGVNTRETDARLDRLVSKLKRPAPLFKTWGLKTRDLGREHARQHSKGGKFWRGIERQTVLVSVDNSGARVECQHFAGWHKEHGGVIKPVNAEALTIPINPKAEGKTAAEFSLGGKQLFILKGTNLLGYSSGTGKSARFVPLFLLVRRVNQKAEPWWPTRQEVSEIGQREGEAWLKMQVNS